MNVNVKAGADGEWFDVVNARDQVVGRELRSVVHAKGLWHRAVHVLVFNAAGQVFLQKRSMTKDMSPGLWDSSCSGHLDAGEDYDPAAQRELGEELGLDESVVPQRWLRVEACAETGWEFCWVYRLEHAGPFTLHPEEIARGEWLNPHEVTRQLTCTPTAFCPAFTLIWSRLSPTLT
ncbi:MAG: NUDIX domain-containing protein [Cephaloticoccus sp.]|nr:NUDIX domain-containing protein [Cephaloticoccus sp.]MCF7760003.1 NUDIX domain-containing protein [Cephaloticoccus sp.]